MRRTALFVFLLLASCGSGPRARVASAVDSGDFETAWDAYEEFRRTEGGDEDLLARVAGVLLLEEAKSGDEERRRAALLQLGLAGTAGEPLLQTLADAPGVTPERVGALERLARRGREEAQLALRSLADHEDPEIVAAATLGMDPAMDRALLITHLEAEHAGLRAAAASRLRAAAEETEVRDALAQLARVDPEASVRAAAVRALAQAGAEAVETLRERLGDPESSVRFAAVGALFEADRADAREALAPMLEVAPSPAGIEAARLLAQLESDESVTARAFLTRALAAEDPALRSQAGVALAGLPTDAPSLLEPVREALRGEQSPSVRLSLARALWRRDRETARRVLVGLLESDEPMPRVQAATMLASDSHHGAPDVLAGALADASATSAVRRTAARALAREAMQPERSQSALRDRDGLVRIYAAGGILAAAAARS